MNMRRWVVAITVLTAGLTGIPALTADATTASTVTLVAKPVAAKTVTAAAVLRALPVRAETHEGTYNRRYFKHWIDADGDGCNTRAEVLIAESKVKVRRDKNCKIISGKWYSFYDGITVTDPRRVEIDHVVSLAEGWRSGAWRWTAAKRQRFANDLTFARTLLAVSAVSNQAKKDYDAAEWQPRVQARCGHAINSILVKSRWGFTVDPRERSALNRILAGMCGQTRVVLPPKGV